MPELKKKRKENKSSLERKEKPVPMVKIPVANSILYKYLSKQFSFFEKSHMKEENDLVI